MTNCRRWYTSVRDVGYWLGLRARAPKRNVLVGLLYLLVVAVWLDVVVALL